MTGERILVVDDSKHTRDFVADCVLQQNGFVPTLARDGAEGVRLALQAPPDLMILDYEMPKMNGLEVLRAIRTKKLAIPVILSTAHGSEAFAVEVFRLGVRDYVTKPFEVQEMISAIDRSLYAVRLKRQRDDLLTRLTQSNRTLESRVRELNTLYSIGKSVTSLLEHDGLLRRIVEAAMFVTRAQSGAVHMTDPSTGKLRVAASIGVDGGEGRSRTEMMTRVVVRNAQPAATESCVVVPLMIGGRVIGALDVTNRDGTARPFSEHDKYLMQALADYAAVAIENVRLFHELEETKEREKRQIKSMFERYVAPQVVERLLSTPDLANLGGSRQQITTLFADVRGFSALSEQATPEFLVNVLNQHFELSTRAILREEGTLDKFMGDAVMAFFNAPLIQPDHTLRAARAALGMQQSILEAQTEMAPSWRLKFGVGIASGEAVVGNIGASQAMNYTVIGDCVNLARRMQENAKGGQILIDGWSYKRIQDKVEVKALGEMRVKGRTGALPVYELMSLK